MKQCSHCKLTLSESEFYNDKRVLSRLMAHCKDCHALMTGRTSLRKQKRKCPVCGIVFVPSVAHPKYCSDVCKHESELILSRQSRCRNKPNQVKEFWNKKLWMTTEPSSVHTAKNGYQWAIFGYVSIGLHRLVMMRHLGRKLERWEQVHHKNRNKQDNNIENLELTPHGHNYVIMGVMKSEIEKLKEENLNLREELEFMKTMKQFNEVEA